MKRIFITAVISLVVGLVLGLIAGRRLLPSREQVGNYLSGLSVSELPDFFKQLNSRLGFQACPQNAFPGAGTMPVLPEAGR